MRNVALVPAAFAEYQSALIWYSTISKELGGQFDAAFLAGVEKITESPIYSSRLANVIGFIVCVSFLAF